MFRQKQESIKFSDFMSGEYKSIKKEEKTPQRAKTGVKKVTLAGVTIPLAASNIARMFSASPALADGIETVNYMPIEAVPAVAGTGAVMDKLAHAFDPLIEVMVGLALPIAGVMITGGCLLILIGQKEPGFRLIMNSALGYALVTISPLLLALLAEVGKALV